MSFDKQLYTLTSKTDFKCYYCHQILICKDLRIAKRMVFNPKNGRWFETYSFICPICNQLMGIQMDIP